jgi:hypothetical protein
MTCSQDELIKEGYPYFSVVISKLTDQNRDLAQRHALLALEFEEAKRRNLLA